MKLDPDPNRPVVLSDLLTEIEATMVIGYLDSIGIRAMTAGAGGATGWPDAASYTQVVVRHCDEARARLAMAEYHDIGMEATESDSLDHDRFERTDSSNPDFPDSDSPDSPDHSDLR